MIGLRGPGRVVRGCGGAIGWVWVERQKKVSAIGTVLVVCVGNLRMAFGSKVIVR